MNMPSLEALGAVLVIMLMLWAILDARRRNARDAADNPVSTGELLSRHKALHERVTVIESKIGGLATKEDVARLEGEVATVSAKLEGVAGHVESTDEAVVRIEQFLLGQSGPATRRRK